MERLDFNQYDKLAEFVLDKWAKLQICWTFYWKQSTFTYWLMPLLRPVRAKSEAWHVNGAFAKVVYFH